MESIEEIYGRLVIHGNNVRRIPLTNLKIIRGISSTEKNSVEIYLNGIENNSSEFHVDFQNLRGQFQWHNWIYLNTRFIILALVWTWLWYKPGFSVNPSIVFNNLYWILSRGGSVNKKCIDPAASLCLNDETSWLGHNKITINHIFGSLCI